MSQHDEKNGATEAQAGRGLPLYTVTTRGREPAGIHPLARSPEDWARVLEGWGERSFRAKQVFRWIHGKGVLDPAEMTDLSKGLRERLTNEGLKPLAKLVDVRRSSDDTRKLLLELEDGARIECVLIPMTSKSSADADLATFDEEDGPEGGLGRDGAEPLTSDTDGERLTARILGEQLEQKKTRVTLCISTQHGCAMGCVFCASGRRGLIRGLGAAEIVTQVIEARRHLDPDEQLTNLVFMGMGEPLHHYDETARAIRLLTHDDGVGLGLRRMTVSTVGLLRGIERLGADFDGKVGLAVSLHAPNDVLRSKIVPMNDKVGLSQLMDALMRYPLPKRRRITIEYILIDGINDSQANAKELCRLLRPLKVKVNLISMNRVEGTDLLGSSAEQVARFREWVASEGYSCFVRTRRGDDVSAACGQLAFRTELSGGTD
jgi:23S rRNA (adenine2503-C2)-methyltransferase